MFKPCVHEGAERPSSQEGRDASTGSAEDGHHGSEAGGFPGQGCWMLLGVKFVAEDKPTSAFSRDASRDCCRSNLTLKPVVFGVRMG